MLTKADFKYPVYLFYINKYYNLMDSYRVSSKYYDIVSLTLNFSKIKEEKKRISTNKV